MFFFRLFSDYESLRSGRSREALVDMTGGLGQIIDVDEARKKPEEVQDICKDLQESFRYGSLMCASINVISFNMFLLLTLFSILFLKLKLSNSS